MADRCRSCDEDVVWMETKSGSRMLVNILPQDETKRPPAHDETVFDPQVHESHFATCPKADEHRRKR